MTLLGQKILELVTIEASTPKQVDRNDLLNRLEKHSFALIRGLISPQEIHEAKTNFRLAFDPTRDRPTIGESPEEVMGLFQKVSIGGELSNQNIFVQGKKLPKMQRPRFMRTIYTPFWEKDRYGLHDLLRRVCHVRNLLYGFPMDFCIDQREGNLWTAARVHHYPAGGGFLNAHRDEVLPKVNEEKGLISYYQPL